MLNKCNPNRSMSLSGYQKTEEGFSEKVTEEILLSSTETRLLFEHICSSRFKDFFELNLQPLSSNPDGDLLTGWMHINDFFSFLRSESDNVFTKEILAAL